MQLFLEATIQKTDAELMKLDQPLPEHIDLCDKAVGGYQRPCLEALQGARKHGRANLHQQLLELLTMLVSTMHCQTAVAWLRATLLSLASLFETHLESRLQSDLMKVPDFHSNLRSSHLHGASALGRLTFQTNCTLSPRSEHPTPQENPGASHLSEKMLAQCQQKSSG